MGYLQIIGVQQVLELTALPDPSFVLIKTAPSIEGNITHLPHPPFYLNHICCEVGALQDCHQRDSLGKEPF